MFYIASELSAGKEAMKSVHYKQGLAIVAGLLDTVEILRQSFCRTQRQLGEHWRAATCPFICIIHIYRASCSYHSDKKARYFCEVARSPPISSQEYERGN